MGSNDNPDGSYDVGRPGAHIPRRVIKGGSHLCAPSYRLRYRPAARQPQAVDTSTSHRVPLRSSLTSAGSEKASGQLPPDVAFEGNLHGTPVLDTDQS
jgi:hypothetical protein